MKTQLNPLALVPAVVLLGAAVSAHAGTVTGVEVTEQADATEIRVRGIDHPSYSVYRLRDPLRLFVDIADSDVANDLGAIDVDNGVVGVVAATEYTDELTTVARLVVGFDQDALYDVDTDGEDLVITIEGAGRNLFVGTEPSSDEDLALLGRELTESTERVALLEVAVAEASARSSSLEAEVLQANLARARSERDRLAALAAQHDLAVEITSLNDALATSTARVTALEAERLASAQDVASYQQELARLEADRADALSRIDALQAAAGRSDRAVAARDAEIASLQAEVQSATAAVTLAAQAGAEQARIEELAAARDARVRDLESHQRSLQAAIDQAAQDRADLERALGEAQAAQVEQQRVIQEQASAIAALETTPAPATGPIEDIRFERVDDVDRVVIEVPSGVEFETLPFEGGRSAIVFHDTTLPDALRRTLDTQAFNGSVEFVSSYTDADGAVRVVAELGEAAAEFLRREGGRIVWEFTQLEEVAQSGLGMSAPQTSAATRPSGDITSAAGDTRYVAQTQIENPIADLPFLQRPVMTRKRITIDLRDADIENVIRLIADEGNINVVAGAGVGGTVTVRLRSVPLDDALMVILRSQGLGWQQTGNILRVAPIAEFSTAYDAAQEHMARSWEREPLTVRLLPVSYATAADLEGLVRGVLSSRGRVVVDARNNALIMTDLRDNLDTAEALVARVDTQTPQILIEARIVETNDGFRRQLGIQWGGDFLADQSTGNATGLLFPSTIGIAGGASGGDAPTAGTSSSPNFAVNLPAPAGTGEGGAVGFTFGSLSGAFNLNVRLSAAENEGTLKVVSAPRIMTSDNTVASITSGVSVPVQVVSAAGAQTVFFDASLSLNVVPRVTPDGNVFLTVRISKNEPDFENTGARGDPSIIRREAATQLLVGDGDTTVIGGIFQRNTGYSQSRVPFFGSLPVIGPLFRNSSQTDVRNELLVFITPRIVNRDLSIGSLSSGVEVQTVDR